jgi:hypothetical protein
MMMMGRRRCVSEATSYYYLLAGVIYNHCDKSFSYFLQGEVVQYKEVKISETNGAPPAGRAGGSRQRARAIMIISMHAF